MIKNRNSNRYIPVWLRRYGEYEPSYIQVSSHGRGRKKGAVVVEGTRHKYHAFTAPLEHEPTQAIPIPAQNKSPGHEIIMMELRLDSCAKSYPVRNTLSEILLLLLP